MKKFDINKWKREQKELSNNKRALTSKPPIRNKNKNLLPENNPLGIKEAFSTTSLLTEQITTFWNNNSNNNWWSLSCPTTWGGSNDYKAHLYVCDGMGTTEVYRFTSTPGATDTTIESATDDALLNSMGISTVIDGNTIQSNLHSLYLYVENPGFCQDNPNSSPPGFDTTSTTSVDCLNPYSANGIACGGGDCEGIWTDSSWNSPMFPTNYYNNSGTYHGFGPGGFSNLFVGAPGPEGITPIDVIHHCKEFGGVIGNFVCPDMSSPCGGMWAGDETHQPITVTAQGVVGATPVTIATPTTGNFYNGYADASAQMVWSGIVQSATPALQGFLTAFNNCNGPNGVCDDSHYIFGCQDVGLSINHNIENTDSNGYAGGSMYEWDASANGNTGGWVASGNTLNSWYGGLTGASNVDYNTWTYDPGTGLYTDDGIPLTGDTEGCGVDGVPDLSNKGCCMYMGCPSDTGDSNYLVKNLGVWDPTGTYVDHTSVGINGTISIVATDLTSYLSPRAIGCPSTADPAVPDLLTDYGLYSCCEIVGCPPDYDTAYPGVYSGETMRYDASSTPTHIKTDPYTWETIGALATDFRDNAKVGCDTYDMVTTGTGIPTTVPNPTDYSCCKPIVGDNLDMGCHDPNALNYNIQFLDQTTPNNSQGCPDKTPGNYQNNQPDPTDYSCCKYSGCPDANLHPGPGAPTGTNLATNAGHFNGSAAVDGNLVLIPTSITDEIGLFYNINEDYGTFGCENGTDVLGITNFDCCEYPSFGCPDPESHNYDPNGDGSATDGCADTQLWVGDTYSEIEGGISPANPEDTSCCKYLGCFDGNDIGNSTAENFGPTEGDGSPVSVLGGLDQFGFPANGYQTVGGNTGCDDTLGTLLYGGNLECCIYMGCTEQTATNYDPTANTPCNTVSDNDCCVWGGCGDTTTSTFKHPDTGAIVEYYLASNYSPVAGGCEVNGSPDPSNFDCCKYYTCKDSDAFNFNYTPDVESFFLLDDEVNGYNLADTYNPSYNVLDIGCPKKEYNILDENSFLDFATGGFPDSWSPDYITDWCCAYSGCPHGPSLDGNGDPDGIYPGARNFDGGNIGTYPIANGYDPKDYYWGCNIDNGNFNQSNWDPFNFDPSQITDYYGCCSYAGCSDTDADNISSINTAVYGLYTPDPTFFYDNQMTCESGFTNNSFGPDQIFDTDDYECCEYEGCSDADAVNFIQKDQGIIGCDVTGIITPGDTSCCAFIGCPDNGGLNSSPTQALGVGAYNYGVFEGAWNNPSFFNPLGVTSGTFGCSLDGINIETNPGLNHRYYSCCQYKVGCTDPLAITPDSFPGVSYGSDCPSCNYDPLALGCYANSQVGMNVHGASWPSGLSEDDGIITNGLAYGILVDPPFSSGSTNPFECCNYQLGCSLDPTAGASFTGYDPDSYVVGNVGCDDGTGMLATDDLSGVNIVNPIYACCGDPIQYGCTDMIAVPCITPNDPPGCYDPLNQVGCPSGYTGAGICTAEPNGAPFSLLEDDCIGGANGGAGTWTSNESPNQNTPSNFSYWCCNYTGKFACDKSEAISVQQLSLPLIAPTITETINNTSEVLTMVELRGHTFTGQLQPDTLNAVVNWYNTAFLLDTIDPSTNHTLANGGQSPFWCYEKYEVTSGPNYGEIVEIIHPECYSYYSVGCDQFPGSNIPAGSDCCMYDYGCPSPGSDNYNLNQPQGSRGGGCSSLKATPVNDSTKWRGIADPQDDDCCEWTDQDMIGCNNPIAANYKGTAIGCQPQTGVGTGVPDVTQAPDSSETWCCEYFYFCADSDASNYDINNLNNLTSPFTPGHSYNALPGCNPDADGNTLPLGTTTNSSTLPLNNNSLQGTNCCTYSYGCAQSSDTNGIAIIISNTSLNYYDGSNPGCPSDGNTDLNPLTNPGYGNPSDQNNTTCCRYSYGCPDDNDPATGQSYQGCDPSPTGTPGSLTYLNEGFSAPSGYGCCNNQTYGCTYNDHEIIIQGTGINFDPINYTPIGGGIDGCADEVQFSEMTSGICSDIAFTTQATCLSPNIWTDAVYWFTIYNVSANATNPLPEPTNNFCCMWEYACADPLADQDTSLGNSAGTNTNTTNPGCNPGIPDPTNALNVLTWNGTTMISVPEPVDVSTVLSNQSGDYAIPLPSNISCCTYALPTYDYGCAESTAENYDSGADGCQSGTCSDSFSSNEINCLNASGIWTLSPNTTPPVNGDNTCCMYTYGCNDPKATTNNIDFNNPNIYNASNLGCHPGSHNTTYAIDESVYGDIYPNTGLYTDYKKWIIQDEFMHTDSFGNFVSSEPSVSNKNCCIYEYICPLENQFSWDPSSVNLIPALVSPSVDGGCRVDGVASTTPSHRAWIYSTLPGSNGTKCCVYEYGCDDVNATGGSANSGNPGCNADTLATPLASGGTGLNLGNYMAINPSVSVNNIQYTNPNYNLWNDISYGTTPPTVGNTNCCVYGACTPGTTLDYWPGEIDFSSFSSLGDMYGATGVDLTGIAIPPPSNDTCCIDTWAANYQGVSEPGTWVYVNTPIDCSCDCIGNQTGCPGFDANSPIDDDRYLQVDCNGIVLCDKCCLNKSAAQASLTISPGIITGGSTWFQVPNNVEGIQQLANAGLSNPSSPTNIIPYDVNNADSWQFYMVPAWSLAMPAGSSGPNQFSNPSALDPGFPNGINLNNMGCACTDPVSGEPSVDIIEIDCWTGWKIDYDVPCLDDLSPTSGSYSGTFLNTQIYAALGELYADPANPNLSPSFVSTISEDDMDANCGCHIFDEGHPDVQNSNMGPRDGFANDVYDPGNGDERLAYKSVDCGVMSEIDPTPVYCVTSKVWREDKKKCDWPCPRDWCWCKDWDRTQTAPGSEFDIEWCCGDPTTGIIDQSSCRFPEKTDYTELDHIDYDPNHWHYNEDDYPDGHFSQNPKYIYALVDNWLNCPSIEHVKGNTGWGSMDSSGYGDGTFSTPFDQNIFNTTSGDNGQFPSNSTIAIGAEQMIVPKNTSCNPEYNPSMIPKPYDSPPGVNGYQYGFPTAYWTCGCPDIHYLPSDIVATKMISNGQMGPNYIFPAGYNMRNPGTNTFPLSSMGHSHHGCPGGGPGGSNQPNPIAYERTNALVVEDDWEDKVDCCKPPAQNPGDMGECPVEFISLNYSNPSISSDAVGYWIGDGLFPNDGAFSNAPDTHVSSNLSNYQGLNPLNPFASGPENKTLPNSTAGGYCLPSSFVTSPEFNSLQVSHPSTLNNSVDTAPPPNWPSTITSQGASGCPSITEAYTVLNYNPASPGCPKLWWEENGSNGFLNTSTEFSQMDLSCCEVGPKTTITDGDISPLVGCNNSLNSSDSGASVHPNGIGFDYLGATMGNIAGISVFLLDDGSYDPDNLSCGCNLQFATMWGSPFKQTLSMNFQWMADYTEPWSGVPNYLPNDTWPEEWHNSPTFSFWHMKAGKPPNNSMPQLSNHSDGNSTHLAGQPGASLHYTNFPSHGHIHHGGAPMCSWPGGLPHYTSPNPGHDSIVWGGTNAVMGKHRPYNALMGTSIDPGDNHVVINDSFTNMGCPDPALGGLPNPLNITCCRYQIVPPDDAEEFGCYNMYGTPSAKIANPNGNNCGGKFNCYDIIALNKTLGGMDETTGQITLWPGLGMEGIPDELYSTFTKEYENMMECTPENAQDWLLDENGEPMVGIDGNQLTQSDELLPIEEPGTLSEQDNLDIPTPIRGDSEQNKGKFNETECGPLQGYYDIIYKMNDKVQSKDIPNQDELAIRQLKDLDPSTFNLQLITPEQCDDFFEGKQIQVDDQNVIQKIQNDLEKSELKGNTEESIRLQRSLNYYKELSKFCNNLIPEGCNELLEDSPWFISESAECIECANNDIMTIAQQNNTKAADFLKTVELPENPNLEDINQILGDNTTEEDIIKANPNCQCCPNAESRTLEPPKETKTDKTIDKPLDVPVDEPKDTDIKPTDFELPTDKEPEVKPEVEPEVEPKVEPLKTAEQLEYERLTAEYEEEKERLLAQGWTEGNIDPESDDPNNFDVRILINQDKVEVIFHKERPTTPEPTEPTEPTEPEVTPDDFNLPTEPVPEPPSPPAEEPKITKEELKQMVKNAIREIKKDLKNKR